VIPTSGKVFGTYAVVVQLTIDGTAPSSGTERDVQRHHHLPAAAAARFRERRTFTIHGKPGSFPFQAVFRQPFTRSAKATC